MSTRIKLHVFCSLAVAGVLNGGVLLAADVNEADLVPFVLPWNDASKGPTDVSFLNHVPAGKFGPIHAGPDGHLYAGDERIRFLGVNLCFAGTLPSAEHADGVAARMAKFGINVVRFHHMDWRGFPGGYLKRDAGGKAVVDPKSLETLDNFLARLKAHGIYANINLLVGRPFAAADGLPAEIEKLDWKVRHAVGMFYPSMIELQKEYARGLLGHRNPQTGLTLAADPGVAFVEINNENGLMHTWMGGHFDDLPRPFAEELSKQWTVWLRKMHADDAALNRAWKTRREPLGPELLAKPGAGESKWNLEAHAGAVAKAGPDAAAGASAVRIQVEKPGPEAWHVQFNHGGLQITEGGLYTLSFRARAEQDRRMRLDLGQAHEPWQLLGWGTDLRLTKEWKRFEFTILAPRGDDNARINFGGMGRDEGSVWLADVSLRPGGAAGLAADESLEKGTLPLVRYRGDRVWPIEARQDFIRFLWDAERDYWATMREYVRGELKFKGVLIGTIVGCSTPNLQAEFDAVDGHAYWQHPEFPGREWDMSNWIVRNRSMVTEAGGVLTGLSMRRVEGKPFTVTEYNHPAPNTYSSEAPLLLAAHAALQDWDGIYLFDYNSSANWDARRMEGFFDVAQHATKMANLPAAALIFRGGRVAPARQAVVTSLPADAEPGLIARVGQAWGVLEGHQLGLDPAVSLMHRTALKVGRVASPKADVPALRDRALIASDTGEVTWDRRQKGQEMVTIRAPRARAVIGFVDGRTMTLGDVKLTPGPTLQGWCTLTLVQTEGDSFRSPGRALLTATGYVQNSGMRWKNAERSTVGTDFGQAPTLVESVPAKVVLPVAPQRLEIWVLDERGQRRKQLEARSAGDGASEFSIAGARSLWFELAWK